MTHLSSIFGSEILWLSDLYKRFKIVLLLSLQSTKAAGLYGMAKLFVEVVDTGTERFTDERMLNF